MITKAMLVLAALSALSSVCVRAADAPGAACALLTQAEIDAATAQKSAAGHAMDQEIPSAAGPHMTMYMCLWALAAVDGQLVASFGPLPPGETAKSLSKNNAGMDALRAQNYTEESKDFGETTCSSVTPPAAVKDGAMMSVCTAAIKGKIISVTFMSPTKKISLEQTRELLDKAIARLH